MVRLARFERVARPQPFLLRHLVAGKLQPVPLRGFVDGRQTRLIVPSDKKRQRDADVISLLKRALFPLSLLVAAVLLRPLPLLLDIRNAKFGRRVVAHTWLVILLVVWPVVPAVPFAV